MRKKVSQFVSLFALSGSACVKGARRTLVKFILPYVCFKFVRQEAVGIYNIPWPPKKIAAQISYHVCLPKTAQICAACTANWPKLPKNELQKNIWYTYALRIYHMMTSFKNDIVRKKNFYVTFFTSE
jgi:hypothetical protein